jgi:type III pantothenate kinase
MVDYIIDAGNSYVKIATIKNEKIDAVERIPVLELNRIKSKIKGKTVILSSVSNENIREEIYNDSIILFELNKNVSLPFKSNYLTPETWGMDRACNVCSALSKEIKTAILIVDIGTCIKFDFIDNNEIYQGGSISPGVNLRFQSLHSGTAKLPLITPSISFGLIGKSTKDSLMNGVMTGMHCEIMAMIALYEQQFEKLTVILTGGDLNYFDFPKKSNIFAEPNLTIEGLYQLYKFQAE